MTGIGIFIIPPLFERSMNNRLTNITIVLFAAVSLVEGALSGMKRASAAILKRLERKKKASVPTIEMTISFRIFLPSFPISISKTRKHRTLYLLK